MADQWTKDRPTDLKSHVAEHVSLGCLDVSGSLGVQAMPVGYALMLDIDHLYRYWLRHDGVESVIHWDKWAVYRGAKKDSKLMEAH